MGKAWTVLLPLLALLLAACGRGSAAVGPAGKATSPGVLVGVAASDGVGIGATNPDSDNWVAQLGARLPAGTRVINLGISGATAAQAAEQELPVVVDAHAGDVAIWLGVNDYEQRVSLANFSASLQQILARLHSETRVRLFVGNLPDLRLLSAFAGRDPAALDADVQRWNAEIARVSTASGAVVVDIYTAFSALKEKTGLISGDGLHPTTAGYRRIADLFYQAMRSAA